MSWIEKLDHDIVINRKWLREQVIKAIVNCESYSHRCDYCTRYDACELISLRMMIEDDSKVKKIDREVKEKN